MVVMMLLRRGGECRTAHSAPGADDKLAASSHRAHWPGAIAEPVFATSIGSEVGTKKSNILPVYPA